MKPLLGLISTLLLLNSASVLASDAALGQRLFSQSRCLECHGAEVFTSPIRKVQNLQQLEQKYANVTLVLAPIGSMMKSWQWYSI